MAKLNTYEVKGAMVASLQLMGIIPGEGGEFETVLLSNPALVEFVQEYAGIDGVDGRDIELRKGSTNIEWRYVDTEDWFALIPIEELQGNKGNPGEKVMLQKSATAIQWKYESEANWTDLVLLADLKGKNGTNGTTTWSTSGSPSSALGLDGDFANDTAASVMYGPKVSGSWGAGISYKGPKGDSGTGLRNRGAWVTGSTYLPGDYVFHTGSLSSSSMWILSGDSAYVSNSAPKDDLSHWIEFVAPAGEDGEDGKSVELRKTSTAIQWRLVGDAAWVDLVSLEDLKGEPGKDGEFTGTSDDLTEGTNHLFHTLARVLSSVLEGFTTGSNEAVASTDTILGALGKLQTQLGFKAPTTSPKFTGVPEAPTAPVGTNTPQLATMAALLASLMNWGLGGAVGTAIRVSDIWTSNNANDINQTGIYSTSATTNTPTGGGNGVIAHFERRFAAGYTWQITIGSAGLGYRTRTAGVWTDWVTLAGLVSPSFTGIPTGPTAAPGTNTTQFATMAALLAGMAAFGLGVAQLTSVADLNTISTASFSRYTSASSNGPVGNQSGTVLTLPYNSARIAQLALHIGQSSANPQLYYRIYADTWTTWQKVNLTAVSGGNNIPAGGTTGQVPVKLSNNDYDIGWATPSSGGGGSGGLNALIQLGNNSVKVYELGSGVTGKLTIWCPALGSNPVTEVVFSTKGGVSTSYPTLSGAIALSSGVLTGTTGLADTVTISFNGTKLYVESRMGWAADISVILSIPAT